MEKLTSTIETTTEILRNLLVVKGVSFMGITYTNKQGEKSRYLVNLGISYGKAKSLDIQTLESMNIATIDTHSLDKDAVELLETARIELIKSFKNPNEAKSRGQKDAYTIVSNTIKIHNATGNIHIYAMRMKKTILVKGEYPQTQYAYSGARPLTRAKNMLRLKYLRTGKYRQFIITPEQLESVRVNSKTMEF